MSHPPLVFFIHGLNTFGDDRFHLGPLAFGPMNEHWRRELESRGVEFIGIDEVGFGSFEDQVDRAFRKVERTLNAMTAVRDVHLFGHSMGGLVARGVGARLKESEALRTRGNLRSIISLGTPHEGTLATEGALDLEKRSPRFYKFLKTIGYDIEARREALEHFRQERIRAFSARHPVLEGVDCVSLIGSVKPHQLGAPMRLFYRQLHPRGEEHESDGLIEASSQKWARVGGIFELDHGAELGAITNLLPRDRRFAKLEFQRLVKTVLDIITPRS